MARKSTKQKVEDALPDPEIKGPSPDPRTNLMLASVVLRGGSMLFRRSVERGLLGARYSPGTAKKIMKGRSLTDTLVGTAIARVATRSVPGAILMAGGLIAKTLYDRKKGAKARVQGELTLEEMAEKGAEQENDDREA